MDTKDLKPEIKSFILSDEFAGSIASVGSKNSLNIDQSSSLVAVVLDYIWGNVKKEELLDKIAFDTETNEDTARAIISDLNTSVLEPLKAKVIASASGTSTEAKVEGNEGDKIEINKAAQNNTVTNVQSNVPELAEEHGLQLVNNNLKQSSVTTTSQYPIDPYREPLK